MKHKISVLVLAMALAACVGLFTACGSNKNDKESTPSDVTTENNNAVTNSENAETNSNVPTEEENTISGGEPQGTADERYVAEVTKLNDDGTLALTLCTPVEGASGEISDYANVTMGDYALSAATVNYTVPDNAVISQAKDGTLTESSADSITVGDRLIIYAKDGVSRIVIYPAKSGK